MRENASPLRRLDYECCKYIDVELATFSDLIDGVPIGTPHFSSDPAQAKRLEDEIERRGLQREYIQALFRQIMTPDAAPISTAWLFIRATPEQRAKAFLEAVK